MLQEEIYKIADQVAKILQSGPVKSEDNGCAKSTPPAINDKLIDEVVGEAKSLIVAHLHSDEEQFLAVGKLRESMSKYWDEQMRASGELSKVNSNRANTLNSFIDMTMPR